MKNLKYLFLLALLITQQGFADVVIIHPDKFKLDTKKARELKNFSSQTNCRDRISKLMCLTGPQDNPDGSTKCLPGGEALAPSIEKVYDVLPTKLQKVFCGLSVIQVDTDIASLAYAGIIRRNAQDKVEGAFIGIRRSLLEQSYDVTSVIGWKEQKAFGIVAPPFVHMPEGPCVSVDLPKTNLVLHYVLVHEIGHIIDFSNSANQFECPTNENCANDDWEGFEKMQPKAGSWGSLSWKKASLPKTEYHFPLWDRLCFYGCDKSLQISDIEPFYQDLTKTNFVTTYAAVSPFEDFAESFTFYVMNLGGPMRYEIQTPNSIYLLDKHWDQLSDKKQWLDHFYNGNLEYPLPIN